MGALIDIANNTEGKDLGYVITERISHEIEHLANEEIFDYSNWFKDIDDIVQITGKIKEGFGILQAASLALVEDNWDNLPLELRKQYNYQFQFYAENRVPDLNWKTIDNYIRAARTFIIDKIRPSYKIPVLKRNVDKSPVLENGEEIIEYVEFDPLNIPPSKLILVRAAAESGKLEDNPELLKRVVDPGYTLHDVRVELYSDRSSVAKISPELKYELIGPCLVVSRAGEEVILIDDNGFNWEAYYNKENPHHDLVAESLRRIFLAVNVTVDEDVISSYLNIRRANHVERNSRRIS